MSFLFTSLDENLVFYGAYHHNRLNQLIHLIFVPVLWWTFAIFASYTGPLISYDLADLCSVVGVPITAVPYAELWVPNLAFFLYLFYTIFYITQGALFAAISFNAVLTALLLSANHFVNVYGAEVAWKYALAIHVFAWFMQIVPGHAIAEKRRPALLDSLWQSFVLAPLFVWLELLFFIGYAPKWHAKLDKMIVADIQKWKAGNKKED